MCRDQGHLNLRLKAGAQPDPSPVVVSPFRLTLTPRAMGRLTSDPTPKPRSTLLWSLAMIGGYGPRNRKPRPRENGASTT